MNRSVTILLTLAALSVAMPAGLAAHCGTTSSSTASVAQGGYYIVSDACQPSCLLSLRVYEESNGVGGLQRGDALVDNTCHGRIASDRLVF